MKQLTFMILGLLVCMVSYAQSTTDPDPEEEGEEVYLSEVDPVGTLGQHKSPALLSHVSYGSQNLYIWSPYTIDLLQVIIRDEDNDIIYSNVCMPLIQGMTTFALPSTVCTDMYSIELIYGDHHLIGYF